MNFDTTQSGLVTPRNLRLLLVFVAVGVILSLGTYFVAGGFERVGVVETMVLIVLAPVLVIIGVMGLRQGLRHLTELGKAWTWWHWVFMLLIISTMVFRVRDNAQVTAAPIDAWALARLIPEAIVAVILFLRAKNPGTAWRQTMFQGLLGVLTVYGSVCVVSSTWSVYPTWTLYKSLEFLMDVAALAAFLVVAKSEADIRKMCNFVWMLYGLDMVWAWLNAAAWPGEALDELGRLSAVWPEISYNSLGASSAVVSIVAFARLIARTPEKQNIRERSWYFLLLAVGLYTLMASQTRNAMGGLVVGFFLVLLYERRLWVGALASAAAVPVLLFTSLGPRVVKFLERDQTAAQIEGMSARVDWWTFAWHQFQRRPLTGFGAYAAGKFAVLGKLGIVASQIHSDWMEILSGSSFWGVLPFAVAFFACWWIIGRSYFDRTLTPNERQWLPEIAGVFGVLSVRSFFNVEMSWHAPLLYFCIIAYAEFIRRERRAQAHTPVSTVRPLREIELFEPVR
jgi:hypothetical protein